MLVSELSRLGRSLRQVLEVVEDLTAAGVNVYFQDHRMNTLKEDGTPEPITKMLISMLGSFAEMEREQIAYRLTDEDILAKYPEVARRLRKGLSIRDAARACGVSPTTAYKVKKAMKPA